MKTDADDNFLKEVTDVFQEIWYDANNITEGIHCNIKKTFDEVNTKAVSRAQLVR